MVNINKGKKGFIKSMKRYKLDEPRFSENFFIQHFIIHKLGELTRFGEIMRFGELMRFVSQAKWYIKTLYTINIHDTMCTSIMKHNGYI